jgi:MATE family multidrug resistance protein
VLAGLACIDALVWSLATEKALLLLKQDPEVARMALQFSRVSLVGVLPSFAYEAVRRTLVAVGTGVPQLVAGVAAIASVAVFDVVFVLKLGLGVVGASLALAISYWVQFLALIITALAQGATRKYFVRPTMEAFHELWPFLRLAVSGAVMLCCEWWSFEILLIIAGVIGPASLSALSVIFNVMALVINIPFSIGIVSSSRVGNHLGANSAALAKAQALMSVAFLFVLELLYLLPIGLCRNIIGRVFSSDDALVALVGSTIHFHLILSVPDGLQAVLSGVLRGCGLQLTGALTNIITFYGIGIPAAALFVFLYRKDLASIYYGFIISPFIQATIFSARLLLLNWTKKADEVAKREIAKKLATDAVVVDTSGIALVPVASSPSDTDIADVEIVNVAEPQEEQT